KTRYYTKVILVRDTAMNCGWLQLRFPPKLNIKRKNLSGIQRTGYLTQHSFCLKTAAFSFPCSAQIFPKMSHPAKFVCGSPGQVHQMRVSFLKKWSSTPLL